MRKAQMVCFNGAVPDDRPDTEEPQMAATALIVSYLPEGAAPPSERAGLQFRLDMIGEALDFHQNGDETDPPCCTTEDPCRIRADLVADVVLLAEQVSRASRTPAIGAADPGRTSGTRSGSGGRAVADPASPAQIEYIKRLAEERATAEIGAYPARTLAEIRAGSEVSKSRASSLITALLDAKKTAASPAQTPAPEVRTSAPTPQVEEDGMYRTPDGEIYKVQAAVHGSGRLYAKRLTKLDEPRQLANGKVRSHEFVYAAGALRELTPEMKMTLAEAKAWGKLYETCCVCGLTLTDDTSIDEGIGPVCGKKF